MHKLIGSVLLLFKPKSVDENIWRKLLSKVEEISSRERVRHDVCLIGSHARGDASPISDIDLVMFSDGKSNIKQTELFYLGDTSITIFPVDVTGLLKAESIDFYNANNPFEARLIHGDGRALDKVREGVFGKRIDLDATKKIMGETLSTRLMSALGDVTLDYGEGIRDMRVCLAKVKLCAKLLMERVDPWSIIPYNYKPKGDLETLLDELYYSKSYEELSSKLVKLDLRNLMAKAFGKQFKTMINVVEKTVGEVKFAGKHVESYVRLYLIVEERVRSAIWDKLPGRWKIEEQLKPKLNHDRTNITYRDEKISWLTSIGEGDSLKLEHYGTTDF